MSTAPESAGSNIQTTVIRWTSSLARLPALSVRQPWAWLIVNGVLGMCNWIYRWYHAEHPTDVDEVKKTFVGMIMKGIVKA